MIHFLFSFVFMLMYGSCVAVLAYNAGKSSKRLVKALNFSGNTIYIDTSNIESVLIDENVEGEGDAGVMVHFGSQARFKCRLADNPWVSDFIKGVGE